MAHTKQSSAQKPEDPRANPRTPEPFHFDPKPKPRKQTDEQILEGVRRFARKRKRLSSDAYERWRHRPCSRSVLWERFGGWHRALVAAGFRAIRPNRTPAELMDILESVWQKLGRPPSRHTLTREGGVSQIPYNAVWGSLPNARRRLADFKAGRITREQLLSKVRRDRRKRLNKGERAQLRPSLRLAVLKRDEYRCVLCGQGVRQKAVLEVDHIVPVCRGGTDEIENLRTLCRACNRGKGKKAA